MNNKFSLQYRSQIEYGIYGGNICTPVCCVVGSNYLLRIHAHQKIRETFNPAKMDSIMKACHCMYAECFALSGVNMMLSEVQGYFPSTLKLQDIAGMTQSTLEEGDSAVEGLIIQPLLTLLNNELKKQDVEKVIIITRLDHTVCYLFDGYGNLLCFDPLEASFRDVTNSWKETIPLLNTEYSGLIMTKK
jgi:hypothetical protein